MKSISHGLYLQDPFQKTTIQQMSSGFVDDITHWNIDMRPRGQQLDDGELITEAQNTAQYWVDLLYTSGGKICLDKSLYYAFYWKYDDEGNPSLQQENQYQTKIELTDPETGESFPIAQQKCDTSHKTLGSMESPSGNYADETTRLREKAKKFASNIATNSLNAREGSALYFSIFLPSITYSLSSGTLSLADAHSIQSPVTRAILPAMRFPYSFTTAMAYAAQDAGGIGLRHLFAEQGVAKTKKLIQSIRTKQPIGDMLLITIQWAQRVAGTSTLILSDTHSRLHQLTDEAWIQTLREFLQLSELQIEIPQIQCPTPKRIHDIILMDCVPARNSSRTITNQINRCRIYLKAETLSDLCTADGTHLRADAYQCNTHGRSMDSSQWPHQTEPGQTHKTKWKSFLRKWCVGRTNKLR
jgi:hypothetical protein